MKNKIVKKWIYFKLGGIKLVYTTLYDKLHNTDLTSEEIYEICKNAKKEVYPKILKYLYFLATGDKLDLNNPKKMNEKIQWMKLYDNSTLKTRCADKYNCRQYVEKTIGKEYLIPLYGVWERFEDINFGTLPNQFVIKCAHGSGFNYIVKDKSKLDKEDLKNKINEWQSTNYAYYNLELQYKDIKPLIIAEEYIGEDIVDYKFFCYNGNCDYVMVCLDRDGGNTRFYYFDKNWELYKYDTVGLEETTVRKIEKPLLLDKMYEISKKLSKGFKFVRVDLYCVNNNIYFGEMTFTPGGGLMTDHTKEFDEYIGSKIALYEGKECK